MFCKIISLCLVVLNCKIHSSSKGHYYFKHIYFLILKSNKSSIQNPVLSLCRKVFTQKHPTLLSTLVKWKTSALTLSTIMLLCIPQTAISQKQCWPWIQLKYHLLSILNKLFCTKQQNTQQFSLLINTFFCRMQPPTWGIYQRQSKATLLQYKNCDSWSQHVPCPLPYRICTHLMCMCLYMTINLTWSYFTQSMKRISNRTDKNEPH